MNVQRGDLAGVPTHNGGTVPVKILSVRAMRHQFGDVAFPVALCRVTADRPGYTRGEIIERRELTDRTGRRYVGLIPDTAIACRSCGGAGFGLWSGGTRADGGVIHARTGCTGAGVVTSSDRARLDAYAAARRVAGSPIYGDELTGDRAPEYRPS